MNVVSPRRDSSDLPDARETTSPATGNVRRVLVVAALYQIPYRVVHCCAALGLEVYVLGSDVSARLRKSNFCRAFQLAKAGIDGSRSEGLAGEINRLIESCAIDMVLPGDSPSTRSLIASRDLIAAPCFPMPTLEQYDLLNNKWRFGALCHSLGVNHPQTKLLESRDELCRELSAPVVRFPVIAKPLNLSGGFGVLTLEKETWREQIKAVDYAPIIFQQFIAGEDIGASVFCRGGRVEGFVAHDFDGQVYTTFFDDGILKDIEKIVAATQYEGVCNFDMRREPDGSLWYLECNPRFYYKMAMTLANGLNFISFGMPDAPQRQAPAICKAKRTRLRFPNKRKFITGLALPWKFEGVSLAALRHMASDPVPFWRDYFYLDDDLVF
jgi:hypothetical protein